MVVAVQAVGDSSESAKRLETRNDSRLDHISRSRDFCRRRPLLAERIHLRVDRFLEILWFHSGLCRRLHFKYGTKNQRLLIHRYVLRNLFFVNEFFV